MPNNTKKSAPSNQRNLVSVIFLALAFLCLLPTMFSYEWSKSIADGLAADGSAERFTPAFYSLLRIAAGGFALLYIGFFLWAFLNSAHFKRYFASQWCALRSSPRHFFEDLRQFFKAVRAQFSNQGVTNWGLLLILLGGIAVRVWVLNRPMGHDESYSVVTWGSGSLQYAISDYHLPNNHVFHTILVNWIYHLFGKTPALLRLPALLSSILLIPLTYLFGKHSYNRASGLLAAGFTAFAPFLIDYSTNARGYTLLALCALAVFTLGVYLHKQENRFGWCLFVVFAVIGFFTLPVMLYPFGAFYCWGALLVLFNRGWNSPADRWRYLRRLIFCGIWTVLLTGLCYLPILTHAGPHALFGNVFVQPLPRADFLPTMHSRMIDLFHAFTDSVPPIVWGLIALGSLLALIFHRKMSRLPLAPQWTFLLWLNVLWLIQRPNLWPRTQIYLWAFVFIWGAAGIVWLFNALFGKDNPVLQGFYITILLLLAALPQFNRAQQIARQISPHEAVIRTILAQNDAGKILITVAPEDDAAIWYYADRYGMEKAVFNKNLPFSVIYVLVNPLNEGFEEPKTLNEVTDRYGPGMAFLDLKTQSVLIDQPDCVLYRFDANQRVIEKTFGPAP